MTNFEIMGKFHKDIPRLRLGEEILNRIIAIIDSNTKRRNT